MSAAAAPVAAYIALGTNLGDREGHLRAAARALSETPGLVVVAASSVYETQPVGGPSQPLYLNAVMQLRTRLDARELLDRLLAIEAERGRERGPERDAPRSLDLDLLLHGSSIIDEPGLCVPHPRLHQRAFVLEPLVELAPELRHPLLSVSLRVLAEAVRDPAHVRRWAESIPVPQPSA